MPLRHGVDESIASLAAFHMLSIPDPDFPPYKHAQLAWLIDRITSHVAIVVDRNPNEPDIQYCVNVFAGLHREGPKIWNTYPPFVVAEVVLALVYRFRVAKAQGASLSKWAEATHRRCEQVARVGASGSSAELFQWVVLGAAEELR